jgi:hypothetical protein
LLFRMIVLLFQYFILSYLFSFRAAYISLEEWNYLDLLSKMLRPALGSLQAPIH